MKGTQWMFNGIRIALWDDYGNASSKFAIHDEYMMILEMTMGTVIAIVVEGSEECVEQIIKVKLLHSMLVDGNAIDETAAWAKATMVEASQLWIESLKAE